MKRYYSIIYWSIVILLLILTYGNKLTGFITSFYFVSFLVPIALITSWYFNNFLIPDYLLKKRYLGFILVTLITVVISLDLMGVLFFIAFILVTRFQPESLADLISHYHSFPLVVYLAVIINGFLNLSQDYLKTLEDIKTLGEREEKFASDYLQVRANRQNKNISYSSINYIESMSDYVLIRTIDGEAIITRETIGRIEKNLSASFLRIHRSFIVNLANVDSFTREYILISDKELPISRTYRKKVFAILKM